MDLPDLPSKLDSGIGADDGDGDKGDVKPAPPAPMAKSGREPDLGSGNVGLPFTGPATSEPASPAVDESVVGSVRNSMAPVAVDIPISVSSKRRNSSRSRRRSPVSFTLQSGYFGMQGRRPTMEDYHTQLQHPEINMLADSQQTPVQDRVHRSLFAIYDGHGGQWCADYCSKMVQHNLIAHGKFREKGSAALTDAIVKTDEAFCTLAREKGFNDSSGSTAIVVYIVDDQIIVANVGDSRAVLCRAGRCLPLSSDHKPNRKDERARITSLGGSVSRKAPKAVDRGDCWMQILLSCCPFTPPGMPPYRVYPGPTTLLVRCDLKIIGGLAISRSIGDLEMKASRLVINTPEIQQIAIVGDDEFVILGCDGVWDVISSEQAVRLVRAYRQNYGDHPMEAAKHLASTAYAEGSFDNISVLVIFFRKNSKPKRSR